MHKVALADAVPYVGWWCTHVGGEILSLPRAIFDDDHFGHVNAYITLSSNLKILFKNITVVTT